MRRKHTFLLTIFPSEEQQPALHGRLQFISNGQSYTFNTIEELQQLIEGSITGQQADDETQQIREDPPHYAARSSNYPSQYGEEV